jgi:hypothetical protein
MKPFLQGRKTLAIEPLRLPPGLMPARAPGCSPGKSSPSQSDAPTASVEVMKEGDKVVRLCVTCACGERIEIDCLYPAGG